MAEAAKTVAQRIEWIAAALLGRARAKFTGKIIVEVNFNQGGITKSRLYEAVEQNNSN